MRRIKFCDIYCSLFVPAIALVPQISSCSLITDTEIEISGDKIFNWDCIGTRSVIQITWKNLYADYVTQPQLQFINSTKNFNDYFSIINSVKTENSLTITYNCIATGNTVATDIEKIMITENIIHSHTLSKTITTSDSASGMNFSANGTINSDASPTSYLSDDELKQPPTDGAQYNTISVIQDGYMNADHNTKFLSINIMMADICYTLQKIKENLLNSVLFHIPLIGDLKITNLDDIKIQYDLNYDFSTQIFNHLNIHIIGHPVINSILSGNLDINTSINNYRVIGAFGLDNNYKKDVGSFHNDYQNDNIINQDKFISIVPNDLSSVTNTSVSFGFTFATLNFKIQETIVNWMENFGLLGLDRFASPDGYWYNALGAFHDQSFYLDSYWLKNIPTLRPCDIVDGGLFSIDPHYLNKFSTRNDFSTNFLGHAPEDAYSQTIYPDRHNLLYMSGTYIDGSKMTTINTDGYTYNDKVGNHTEVVSRWDSMITNDAYRHIHVNSGVINHDVYPYYQILDSLFCNPNETDGVVKNDIMLINPVFGYDSSNDNDKLRCDNSANVTFTT